MENEIIKTEEMQPSNGAYKQLLTDIGQLITDGRKQVLFAVNTAMLQMYWGIGQHIVEYEQNGELRAQYGKSLLSTISKDLTQLYLPKREDFQARMDDIMQEEDKRKE